MNTKQKITWLLCAILLIAAAAATSWIDHSSGARTLTRAAITMMVGITIAEFWVGVPTTPRKKNRYNARKVQP